MKGHNANGNARCFRVLMPSSYVFEILKNLEPKLYFDEGGIRACWDNRENRDTEVFLLRTAGPCPPDWTKVGGPYIEIKMFELGVNYTVEMNRFQMRQREFS